MAKRGFTIVELIITVVIITIIMLLAVASLRSSQVAARNDERDIKARTIANGLESYYRHGNRLNNLPPGSYPDTTTLTNAIANGTIHQLLTGVEASTLQFNWQDDGVNIKSYSNQTNTHLNGNIADITDRATSSQRILYEPLALRTVNSPEDNDRWTGCVSTAQTCMRYNLYYITEGTNQLVTIKGNEG